MWIRSLMKDSMGSASFLGPALALLSIRRTWKTSPPFHPRFQACRSASAHHPDETTQARRHLHFLGH
ncbi:hypothetical protein ASE71_24525 [Ensifer sp. Root954]|nr:hypothetical protein ASD49_08970 [Ensifer sp. Root1298]KQX73190.1 hypothetical protein ASD41_09225 [Ensifer sp. Root1312]KRC16084.1 hypothetical protein ASE29_09030 [Ensifer sp. Root74]KRD70236.1 hypothetical protein ASE71_24525 [Ensifer sp. Root954]KSV72959.1 hypothetical protein N182_28975 [Sinorhizobium sp. GL2]